MLFSRILQKNIAVIVIILFESRQNIAVRKEYFHTTHYNLNAYKDTL